MMKVALNKLSPYKSWITSAGITIAIALWLASGHMGGGTKSYGSEQHPQVTTAPRASVRVRHQFAEEFTRNIIVNGRTAPARIVELNAETDGRVVGVGVERGDRFNAGDVIVQLDERDRRVVAETIKYAGYIERQRREADRLARAGARTIPSGFTYRGLSGLSHELVEKLERVRPESLGRASRIDGMTPAALGLLAVHLQRPGPGHSGH